MSKKGCNNIYKPNNKKCIRCKYKQACQKPKFDSKWESLAFKLFCGHY